MEPRLEILSLIEEEEEELVLEDEGMRTEVQSFDLYLVGRFLAYIQGLILMPWETKCALYMDFWQPSLITPPAQRRWGAYPDCH